MKTLHPKIHGGLLGRRSVPAHVDQMKQHHIGNIDVVVVNLYPSKPPLRNPTARSRKRSRTSTSATPRCSDRRRRTMRTCLWSSIRGTMSGCSMR
ncbi:MAG: hypothetical protein U0361_00755 [Nitrospiraceae bacterium]